MTISHADKRNREAILDPSFFDSPFDNVYIQFRPISSRMEINAVHTVQALYNAFCLATDNDLPGGASLHQNAVNMLPTANVTLLQALMFCNWLSLVLNAPAPYILICIFEKSIPVDMIYMHNWYVFLNPQIIDSPVQPIGLLTVEDYERIEDSPEESQPNHLQEVASSEPNGQGIYDAGYNASELLLNEEPEYMTPKIWKDLLGNREYLDFIPFTNDLKQFTYGDAA